MKVRLLIFVICDNSSEGIMGSLSQHHCFCICEAFASCCPDLRDLIDCSRISELRMLRMNKNTTSCNNETRGVMLLSIKTAGETDRHHYLS